MLAEKKAALEKRMAAEKKEDEDDILEDVVDPLPNRKL